MKTEFSFIIDNNKKIMISIPNLPLKFNYYYEPTEKLHKFDEATAYLITMQNQMVLHQDMLDDIILSFEGTLKKVVSNNLPLPSTIKPGNAGAELNMMLNDISDLNMKPYWVWSSLERTHTLLYNYDNKIYLEISPGCPDLFTDKPARTINKLFKEFMKTHKPYFVIEIPLETAKKWLEQSEQIIQMINFKRYINNYDIMVETYLLTKKTFMN